MKSERLEKRRKSISKEITERVNKHFNDMETTEQIKATANKSKRTFTIRKYIDGKLFSKYRTIPLSKEEFQSEEMNTENDWKQFLKSDDYYKC
jgi:hypothetical protein